MDIRFEPESDSGLIDEGQKYGDNGVPVILRCGLLNISSMYRICIVYVSYMYRICIVFLS